MNVSRLERIIAPIALGISLLSLLSLYFAWQGNQIQDRQVSPDLELITSMYISVHDENRDRSYRSYRCFHEFTVGNAGGAAAFISNYSTLLYMRPDLLSGPSLTTNGAMSSEGAALQLPIITSAFPEYIKHAAFIVLSNEFETPILRYSAPPAGDIHYWKDANQRFPVTIPAQSTYTFRAQTDLFLTEMEPPDPGYWVTYILYPHRGDPIETDQMPCLDFDGE